MTHHHFKAPWDRTLLIISIFMTLMTIGTAIVLTLGRQMPPFLSLPALPSRALVIAAVLLIPLGALPFMIRGYVLTKDGILIKRLWWNTVLPFAEMRSVEVEPLALSHSFRTCGNGGMFSFTGFYWSRQLGHFRAYVTDQNRTVIVHMNNRTAVLSPDDPEAFARAVTSHLHA
ncbi:MAG: PH domain-containing protein [Prosthecobacter sp.]